MSGKSPREFVICSCGRKVAVNPVSGTLRLHEEKRRKDGVWQGRCPESGQPPWTEGA